MHSADPVKSIDLYILPFRRRYLRINADASMTMITKTPAVTPPAIAPP